MRYELLFISVSFGIACGSAAAQGPSDFNRLNEELQKRFVDPPAARRAAPPSSPTPPDRGPKDNYNWIKPEDQPGLRAPPAATPASPSGARAVPLGAITAAPSVLALAGAPAPPAAPTAQELSAPQTQFDLLQEAIVQRSAPETPKQIPLTRRNSYVILLRPEILDRSDGGARNVAELLSKYGLSITPSSKSKRLISPSGRLIVEFADESTETSRRLKAPDVSADAPEPAAAANLKAQLSPGIITQLRQEPIVDSAYVNSTINANTLPRAVSTSVRFDGNLYRWSWTNPAGASPQFRDGNWGLKAIRMPVVWSIMKRFHELNPSAARPKIAVVDQGFSKHSNLAFSLVDGSLLAASAAPDCDRGHGTHVAGIIGAVTLNGSRIDGIIPNNPGVRLDAVPFRSELFFDVVDSAQEDWYSRWAQFADVLNDIEDYIVSQGAAADPLRVINLSLGYNLGRILNQAPETIDSLKTHVLAQSKDAQRTARRFRDRILFLVAAGNDASAFPAPLHAKWGSPFGWAGTQDFTTSPRAENVLVVEAIDPSGNRADFSNVGGHISAPGVGILSTLGPGTDVFGVCSGTSQAAPHAAAIATLLFALAPAKSPQEIADILRQTASPVADDASEAPHLDALEAIVKVYPQGLKLLADLNSDDVVDEADLAIFKDQVREIGANRATGAAFSHDLNGDEVVDNSECLWPAADLNGSGIASLASSDRRSVRGAPRSDLDVMKIAWTRGEDDFQRALTRSELMADQAANATPPASACR